jgi:hypothetical protein
MLCRCAGLCRVLRKFPRKSIFGQSFEGRGRDTSHLVPTGWLYLWGYSPHCKVFATKERFSRDSRPD